MEVLSNVYVHCANDYKSLLRVRDKQELGRATLNSRSGGTMNIASWSARW